MGVTDPCPGTWGRTGESEGIMHPLVGRTHPHVFPILGCSRTCVSADAMHVRNMQGGIPGSMGFGGWGGIGATHPCWGT